MKSEFMLAFNQICSERNLPRDVVLQALESALVSAYRRSVNASAAQNIVAKVDPTTGTTSIYVEKEVVEQVQDSSTEVVLKEARRSVPDAALNDMVMVESTPEDFGRVAAQMAKQVILQRIREAERDALFANFSEREGEIINGTVQSVTPQAVTLNLGRTEAALPKNQQVPGERYTMHQRLRAYVLEVRKSPRGPQIIVSRNHKNMLRRLVELEVPEIYNGTVEIKSIAREAGARSKIAVAALQAGVDPVGSCVGMKGVRIQSIVNELNGEKIDVIEWSNDPTIYIAKALSPARVLAVYADDDMRRGKTAQVIVPDDQLSLAIGRDGQNARLAAKLTNWRIDIKSASEAATEVEHYAQDAQWISGLGQEAADLIPTLQAILKRHVEYQLPWNSEEQHVLRRVLDAQSAMRLRQRQAELAQARQAAELSQSGAQAEQQAETDALVARIPEAAQDIALSDIGLTERVLKHMKRAGLHTVAEVLQRQAAGDEAMLSVEGIGPRALAEIKTQIEASGLWFAPPAEAVAQAEITPAAPTAATSEVTETEALGETAAPAEEVSSEAEKAAAVEATTPVVEQAAHVEAPSETPAETPAAKVEAQVEAPPIRQFVPDLEEDEEDLDRDSDKDKKKKKEKRRQLIFDERRGKVIAKRERKPGRARDAWGMDEDF
jgi:N utilization substance protein A